MKTALLTSILLLSIATVSCNRASSRDPDRVAADAQRPESTPVAAPVAAADSGNPGKRALLVGINKYKYPDKISPLAGPVNDVEAMRQILTGKFDFAASNVATLKNEQATHAAIVNAIQNELIAKAQKDDIVLFYYSGHGSQMKDVSGDEPDGWDETLVPYDSRDPQGKVFDISDDEINGLMRQVSAKTKNVTVIMDSCHSGTGMRGVEDAVLRVREIPPDTRAAPSPPTYAIGQRGSDSFAAGTFKYALISAAREKQVAFEHLSNGVERGVLSFFLTQALAKLKRPTYRDLMDVVSTQVSAAYPNQNPQLEGADIDQFVFGDASSLPLPYFLITTGGTAKVVLGAGQLHGVTAGSLFRVYAPGSKRFSPPDRPIANVRVSAVTPYTSEGNILSKGSVPDSSRAVEQEHRYENLRLRVYLDGPPDSAELEAVRQELADDKHIEFVSAAARCHVQVRQRGTRFLTLSADGYTLSTPIEVSRADAGARIGGQLAQWAKWFNVFQIQNSQGPDIQFNVSAVRGGPLSARLDGSLKDRDKVDLTIHNKSGKDLYVAVLDLSSDGSIEMSYPVEQGAAELLKAGGTVTHRVEMFVPQGRSVVKDTFKLFASTKAVDLRPITQGRIKGAPDIAPGDDPLNDLIAEAAGRMRGSRPVDTGQWTTAQRTVIVRR